MTAITFLYALRERGVELLLDPEAPSGLRYRAPRGVVTVRVADTIRRSAPALRSLLNAPETASDAPMAPAASTAPVDAPMARLGTDVLSGVPEWLSRCDPPPDWTEADQAAHQAAWADPARRPDYFAPAPWQMRVPAYVGELDIVIEDLRDLALEAFDGV